MPLASLALALAVALAPVTDPAAHSPTSVGSRAPVVILYGDSLAWEAEEHFLAAIAEGTNATAVGRTFGGTAICDFMDLMKDDAASLRPAAVVLEFSGNRFTACMHHADGTGMGDGDAFMKYLTDAKEVVGIFTSVGTHVYLAGAPLSRPVPGSFQRGRGLNVMYSWIALLGPAGTVSYIDAGAAVQDGDEYVDELPCLPDEPCAESDTAVVRSSDGVHLCPGDDSHRDPATARCLVWSSGAYRYGRAMAAPVRSQLLIDRFTRSRRTP